MFCIDNSCITMALFNRMTFQRERLFYIFCKYEDRVSCVSWEVHHIFIRSETGQSKIRQAKTSIL